jgi:hypothetical protein
MPDRLQIGGCEIEYDREATAACYARIRIPHPEACGCAYCRNWVAARERGLPPELQRLLTRLGVPANGEIEVYEMPGTKRPHSYGGWYFVVGRIVSGEQDQFVDMGGFELSLASEGSFAVPEFEGQDIFELHFQTEVDEYLSDAEYASSPKPASYSGSAPQNPIQGL